MQGDDELAKLFALAEARSDFDKPAANPHGEIAREARANLSIPPEDAHACHECNGTGFYRGVRVHQQKAHCFACKGRGWFKMSYADRMALRKKAADKKAEAKRKARELFEEMNPGVTAFLGDAARWSGFAASLNESLGKYGALTEGQLGAVRRMQAKMAANAEARKAKVAANSGEVSLAAIEAIFANAKRSGLRFPKFKAGRVDLSLAAEHSKNAGAVYVKIDGEYAGKVLGGQFSAIARAPAEALELVRKIAADPLVAAREHGRLTGRCSCCGALLRNKESVELGIGPICRTKWGI